MSAHELWTCDWCDRAQEGPYVLDDIARTEGWVKFTRREWRSTVLPAIAAVGGMEGLEEMVLPPQWHVDERHVCGRCLTDLDCRRWLNDFKPHTGSDEANYQRIVEA